MKRTKIIPLLISSILVISGCSSDAQSSDSQYEPEIKEATFKYQASLFHNEDGSPITVQETFEYDQNSFLENGEVFNKQLALLSLSSIVYTQYKNDAETFYNSIEFDNLTFSPDYDAEDSADSVYYCLAHKNIHGKDVVALTYGYSYGDPWEYNFYLEKEGDAEGFMVGARKTIAAFKKYVTDNDYKDVILWSAGYSRTAALSNLTAYYLLEDENPLVNDERVHCYTFESPAALEDKDVKEHRSIHNILNEADLVTCVAPTIYGFTRPGVDYNYYSDDIDQILTEYNENFVLPKFTRTNLYKTEKEFLNYFLKNLSKKKEESAIYRDDPNVFDLATREHYVDHYQEHICYLVKIFISPGYSTLFKIIGDIDISSISNLFDLLNEGVIYELIAPLLTKYGVEYDGEKLSRAFDCFLNYIKTIGSGVLAMFIPEYARTNITRCVEVHLPEVIFVLLKNYEYQAPEEIVSE